jgi:hypothetical protein
LELQNPPPTVTITDKPKRTVEVNGYNIKRCRMIKLTEPEKSLKSFFFLELRQVGRWNFDINLFFSISRKRMKKPANALTKIKRPQIDTVAERKIQETG